MEMTDKHDRVVAYVEEELRAAGYATLECRKTGSAYYGDINPADYDVLVLVSKDTDLKRLAGKMRDGLHGIGWEDCAHRSDTPEYENEENDYYDKWVAIRKGDANAIITSDKVWFYRSLACAVYCKNGEDMLFADKDERIEMFRLIRDGREN